MKPFKQILTLAFAEGQLQELIKNLQFLQQTIEADPNKSPYLTQYADDDCLLVYCLSIHADEVEATLLNLHEELSNASV